MKTLKSDGTNLNVNPALPLWYIGGPTRNQGTRIVILSLRLWRGPVPRFFAAMSVAMESDGSLSERHLVQQRRFNAGRSPRAQAAAIAATRASADGCEAGNSAPIVGLPLPRWAPAVGSFAARITAFESSIDVDPGKHERLASDHIDDPEYILALKMAQAAAEILSSHRNALPADVGRIASSVPTSTLLSATPDAPDAPDAPDPSPSTLGDAGRAVSGAVTAATPPSASGDGSTPPERRPPPRILADVPPPPPPMTPRTVSQSARWDCGPSGGKREAACSSAPGASAAAGGMAMAAAADDGGAPNALDPRPAWVQQSEARLRAEAEAAAQLEARWAAMDAARRERDSQARAEALRSSRDWLLSACADAEEADDWPLDDPDDRWDGGAHASSSFRRARSAPAAPALRGYVPRSRRPQSWSRSVPASVRLPRLTRAAGGSAHVASSLPRPMRRVRVSWSRRNKHVDGGGFSGAGGDGGRGGATEATGPTSSIAGGGGGGGGGDGGGSGDGTTRAETRAGRSTPDPLSPPPPPPPRRRRTPPSGAAATPPPHSTGEEPPAPSPAAPSNPNDELSMVPPPGMPPPPPPRRKRQTQMWL